MAEAPLGLTVCVAILLAGRRLGFEVREAVGRMQFAALAHLAAIALYGIAMFTDGHEMQGWMGLSTFAAWVGWITLVVTTISMAKRDHPTPDRN